MRTSVQLIAELNAVADVPGAEFCIAVLVVAFETENKFVFARDKVALEELNEMISLGGKPVALAQIYQIGQTITFNIRPLDEYQNERWIDAWMKAAAQSAKSAMLESLRQRKQTS